MGIDLIAGGRSKKTVKRTTKSTDPYHQLLHKLYHHLAHRTGNKFNKAIAHRLTQSKSVRAPLSLSKVSRFLAGREDKVAVVVATVTNDVRLLDVPKLKVAALRFTETARARINKAGGQCLNLDEIAAKFPTGKGTVLLRGPKSHRTANKYFGTPPGVIHSHTRPRTLTRRSERNRGFKGQLRHKH
ncbi:MAG: putative 60S ribosomal protein L18-2 [Streblomastix strix]|uniref:Putative 60S ribosomal protein L18-2 n=1 Tax=Streblomastix strix TaxID=222440 RepID=A0A5J4X712_9EUKA|nr:MAG: putative 60S ribosomal protein L18-2 [Streblomastix strix]